MRVERQMRRVERHAVFDQERDDAVLGPRDPRERIAPADPVVHEAEVRALRLRGLEEVQRGVHPAADPRDFSAVGDLQAVVRNVLERIEPQLGVEGLHKGVERDGHG